MRITSVLSTIIILGGIVIGFSIDGPKGMATNHRPRSPHPPERLISKSIPQLDTAAVQSDYLKLRDAIEMQRQKIAGQFDKANSDAAKAAMVDSARNYLLTTLVNQAFPMWYGTEWDFNGITETPLKGEIACGYFVSTTLKHCGFKLNRYKLAQQYSFSIVKTLCDNSSIQRIGHNDLEALINYVEKQPNDLYIIGLDNHVGFIAKTTSGITFIHSNYIDDQVVSEPLAVSDCLEISENYILGHLLSNDQAIENWLTGRQFPILP